MKIKLIYDIEILANAYKINETGIFRVANELLKRLKLEKDVEVIYSFQNFDESRDLVEKVKRFFIDKNETPIYSAKSQRVKFLPFRKEKLFRLIYKKLGVSNYKIITEQEHTISANIFHSLYYPIPNNFLTYTNLKKVVTIHDLIPILFPKLNDNADILEQVVKSIGTENYAICVSENTKRDLLHYAPQIKPENIFVSLLAASPEHFYVCKDKLKFEEIQKKYSIPKKYFLGLSTLEPRKNIDHVIKCFIETVKNNQIEDLYLVLVGSKGWGYDKIFEAYENTEELKSKIIITGRIPDEDLATIYSNADAFFYMSFYEGFGLPPLEAMQCGIPVVVSNNSSLPEVVGKAGILLDAKDEIALCKTMLTLYNNEELRNDYSKRSLERSLNFSWEKTVAKHIEIYQKILQN